MIIDSLSNLKLYTPLNPLFNEVIEFIKNNHLADIKPGIVKIKGDEVFANFSEAEFKTKEQTKLETHNKMVDIQVPITEKETMGFITRDKLGEETYDEQKDLTFYEQKPETYVDVFPGQFAIFFPQDGHAPCIGPEGKIKKVIFKVKA